MENKSIALGDVADLVRRTVQPQEVAGMPYIGLEHIEEGSLCLNGYGQAEDVTSTKFRFSQGDILFGKLRPYFRKVIRAPFDGVCSTDIWIVRAKEGFDQGYLFYWMAAQDFVDFATAGSEGTKMPRAKWEHVSRYERVRLPFNEQRAIAHILGTLDDKIELNRKTNETLEAMARAIFKSWFVDFDPVRAKAAGRDTGLPKEVADLFPDSFEDSELGKIPKGWILGTLGDIATNPRRGVKPDQAPSVTPYIGLQHMPRRCIALDAWGRADEVASQKSQFNEGEILFGKLRPYFHKVGIAPVDGVCSTDILVIVPKTDAWHGYVLSIVSSRAFVDYTDAHSAGTKMPRTNWKDMSRYLLALPPVDIAKAFQNQVAAFYQRIWVNIRQNRRLSGLRDTLLPKLISGELRVKDVEIAEAVQQ